MNIEEKKDQRDELRNKINNIEQALNKENIRLQKTVELHDTLTRLKKSLDCCSAIVLSALEPGTDKLRFDNLIFDNDTEFEKSFNCFNEQTEILKHKVDDLRNERDKAIKEYEDYDEEKNN